MWLFVQDSLKSEFSWNVLLSLRNYVISKGEDCGSYYMVLSALLRLTSTNNHLFFTLLDEDLIDETNLCMYAYENQKMNFSVLFLQSLFFRAFQCLLKLLSWSQFIRCLPPQSNLNIMRSCTSIEFMLDRSIVIFFFRFMSSIVSDLMIFSLCIVLLNYYICICDEAAILNCKEIIIRSSLLQYDCGTIRMI